MSRYLWSFLNGVAFAMGITLVIDSVNDLMDLLREDYASFESEARRISREAPEEASNIYR